MSRINCLRRPYRSTSRITVVRLRRDLGQGDEDEIPRLEPRMRHDELRRLDDQIFGEKDVDIDDPGTFGRGRDPFHLRLDGLGQLQELYGPEAAPDLDHLVQEPGLVREVDRLGLVDGRGPDDPHAGRFELSSRPGQVGGPAAQIAAQAQKEDHARSSPYSSQGGRRVAIRAPFV